MVYTRAIVEVLTQIYEGYVIELRDLILYRYV